MFQLVWEDVKSHWCSSNILTFVGSNAKFQFRLLLYYKPTETSSQSILLDGREYYRNPIFRSSRRLGKTQILSTACLRHPITLFALGSFASFEWFFGFRRILPVWIIMEPSAVCMLTYLQKEGQRTLLVHFIIPSSDSSWHDVFSAHFFLGMPAWSSMHEQKRWH